MKALSLTQPWASLVAIGAKRIETRSWYTPYRGSIFIHASKGFPAWAQEACDEDPFYDLLTRAGLLWPVGDETLTYKAAERYAALPLGAIVAAARIMDVEATGDVARRVGTGWSFELSPLDRWELTKQEAAFGDYSPGRFAWLLGDIRPLASPIPCKGALGLWNVPNEILSQLEAL